MARPLPAASLVIAVALTACASAGGGPAARSHTAPTAASPSAPALDPSASTTPNVAPTAPGVAPVTPVPAPPPAGLAACPATQTEGALTVIAHVGGTPDDLAVTANGGLWVSDEPAGRITELAAGGAVVRVVSDPRGPEGIIPLPDGRLVVGEQTPDRVVVLDPATGEVVTVLAQLTLASGEAGIDSIALDPAAQRVIIPDSARGALRSVPVIGGEVTTLATGLGRPVDAAVWSDGSVYIANEGRPGLWRVPATGGRPEAVAGQYFLDETVAAGGLLYVTGLNDGTVRAIDPATGDSRVLVTGDPNPQGLAPLPDGRLALTDSNRGLVLALDAC